MEKMKKTVIFFVLIIFCTTLVGCGETVAGVGKDISRIGKGVKTIFVKDGFE